MAYGYGECSWEGVNWRTLGVLALVPFLVGSDESARAREAREWAAVLQDWLYGTSVSIESEATTHEQSLDRIDELQTRALEAREAARRGVVWFATGGVELDTSAKLTLREFARRATLLPGVQFQVAGHTDDRPIANARFRSNQELSLARAERVRAFLVREGISGERLHAAGYAAEIPIATNANEEGRMQNRRVELRFVPYRVVHPLLGSAP